MRSKTAATPAVDSMDGTSSRQVGTDSSRSSSRSAALLSSDTSPPRDSSRGRTSRCGAGHARTVMCGSIDLQIARPRARRQEVLCTVFCLFLEAQAPWKENGHDHRCCRPRLVLERGSSRRRSPETIHGSSCQGWTWGSGEDRKHEDLCTRRSIDDRNARAFIEVTGSLQGATRR